MTLDPKFYLTVRTFREFVCAYCGVEATVPFDDDEPYNGGDPLEHDEDCERLEG